MFPCPGLLGRLFVFHIMLFVKKKTTYEWILERREMKRQKDENKEFKRYVPPTLGLCKALFHWSTGAAGVQWAQCLATSDNHRQWSDPLFFWEVFHEPHFQPRTELCDNNSVRKRTLLFLCQFHVVWVMTKDPVHKPHLLAGDTLPLQLYIRSPYESRPPWIRLGHMHDVTTTKALVPRVTYWTN